MPGVDDPILQDAIPELSSAWQMRDDDTQEIKTAIRQMFGSRLYPQKQRSIHEFAEQEVELPKGPRRGMMFDLDFMPFMRFIFDAIEDDYWRKIAIVGPTQTGKSLVGNNIPMLYYLFECNEDVIVGLPNMDLARGIWTEKIKPVIENTRYKMYLPKQGAGAKGGVPSQMLLGNGVSIRFVGAGGGDAQRSSHTARIIIMTEVDKMDTAGEASDEADPVSQIEMRADSFAETSKIIQECTVTVEDGRIWQEAMVLGSAARIYVPCPLCGHYQTLEFDRLTYDETDAMSAEETAAYECVKCDKPWTDQMRVQALNSPVLAHRGQVVDPDGNVTGELPRTRTFGIHYDVLYSPMQSIGKTAAQQLEADRSENKDKKKAFVQSKKARPWVDEEAEYRNLTFSFLNGRKNHSSVEMGTVPEWADHLIFTVDVQKRWLYWHCDAYSRNSRSQVVEYGVVDIMDNSDRAIVKALDMAQDIAEDGWPGDEGKHFVPRLSLYDTGYRYDVLAKWLRGKPKIFGVKGVGKGQRNKMAGEKSRFEIPDIMQVRKQKDGNNIWFIFVDNTKGIVQDRYFIEDPLASGYTIVPSDITTGYMRSITAEVRDEKTGDWVLKRKRNDYLDCRSYSVTGHMYVLLRLDKKDAAIKRKVARNKAEEAGGKKTPNSPYPKPSYMEPEAAKNRRIRRPPLAGGNWLTSRGRHFS